MDDDARACGRTPGPPTRRPAARTDSRFRGARDPGRPSVQAGRRGGGEEIGRRDLCTARRCSPCGRCARRVGRHGRRMPRTRALTALPGGGQRRQDGIRGGADEGRPVAGDDHVGGQPGQAPQRCQRLLVVVVEEDGSSCGPGRGTRACSVISASPTSSAPQCCRWKAQWPDVCPGVKIGTGRPGTSMTSVLNVSTAPSRSTLVTCRAITSRSHTTTSGRQTIDNRVRTDTCSTFSPVALGTSSS